MQPLEPASSDSHPSSSRAFLELRLGDGPSARRALAEPHVVIGRSPQVELVLDHDTVSRRHAELHRDPFGRWWIRDLESTNGTLVNGEPVRERALSPGDRIRIGDFTLRLQPTSPAVSPSDPDLFPDATPSDGSPTMIRTLRDRAEPPRLSATHLSTLMEHQRRFFTLEDPAERLAALCKLTVGADFRATMALVLRLRGSVVLQMLSGPHRPEPACGDDPAPYVSRRVLKMVRERGAPVLASNLASAGPASLELTVSGDVNPLSAIACPLRQDDDSIDVLYITLPQQYGTDEWLALVSLAVEAHQQAETVWTARHHAEAHAAIERELEMARRIQRALVPRDPTFAGLDVAIGFDPCRWVGGDYVDAVPMPDGRVLFTVADVCGKGLHAALVTSCMHTMVRATIEAGSGVVQLMERLNDYLCDYLPEDSFATMVCVAVDAATGEVECVNAGHPPALIVTPSGCSRQLQVAKNAALGVEKAALVAQTELLAAGDLLFLYTDGLTELRNSFRQMLGEERLSAGLAEAYAAARSDRSVTAIARDLAAMLERFRGDQTPEDDRAFLLARRRD